MHSRTSTVDFSRISISSAPSSSSQGSGPDDVESLGDVYIWGELWSDGTDTSFSKTDVLLPKLLESNVVLDVQQIACGSRHAAVLTRQGEVFTWGEEFGGRLGHGTASNVNRPQLVEALTNSSIDYIACGEYHTCAVSMFGDLFTWGDGAYNAGILGHGTSVGYWIPKRVSGPLEGLQVLSIACGTWHSALITSVGKLFTFGDGTYGVLGHGDRQSNIYPREVRSLNGLKTVKVACGVWHTAAIVEVLRPDGTNTLSRKLFTWGDGSGNCLGHGDKDARLVPECVSVLADYDFNQLACGHFLTVGLTTSGHVFTMGSSAYGQLGNAQSDGKIPCLVQDKLAGEVVDEIACGSHHVAVVTSRSEVFTWGRGASGRLGHGDIEDRKTPTLVEALTDRHVKSITCGATFTACVCIHKWVSVGDQSLCSGCRQAFGFTRKRHNCYNCSMVFCHMCSSNKVFKAVLAPTPDKPHRVCDSCFLKLKASETCQSPTANFGNIITRRPTHCRNRSGGHTRPSKLLFLPSIETSEIIEFRAARPVVGSDTTAATSSLVSALLKDISLPGSLSVIQAALKPIMTSTTPPTSNTRPSSPYSATASLTPSSTATSLTDLVDERKKAIGLLNEEIMKLQAQVRNLKEKSEHQETELENTIRKLREAASIAAKKSAKCNYAEDVVRSLVQLIKDVVDGLSSEDSDNLVGLRTRGESWLKAHDSYISHLSSSLRSGNLESSPSNKHISTVRMNDSGADAPSSKEVIGGGEEQCTEQFAPGVYVTFVKLQDADNIFKRVKFSKRRFNEQQAAVWWRENQDRVFKKYGLRTEDTGQPPPIGASSEEDVIAASPS